MRALGKRQGGLAHDFGVDEIYALRASKKLRAIISHQPDGRFQLEAFASRGDKAYFSSEA